MAGIEDMDGDFNFCKDRRRDPFHGNSVRLRGARGCKWQMNDLHSLNPAILAKNRSVKAIHSSTSSASYTPVTAVDMCTSFENIRSASGIQRYGREEAQVLGKRDAWEDVIDTLEEHAISVRPSRYNKSRRTQDLLFEVPIIGQLHWPVLNGKACVPDALNSIAVAALAAVHLCHNTCCNGGDRILIIHSDTTPQFCTCHRARRLLLSAAATATLCQLFSRRALQAAAARFATTSATPSTTARMQDARSQTPRPSSHTHRPSSHTQNMKPETSDPLPSCQIQ
jgi:hypothetical protein